MSTKEVTTDQQASKGENLSMMVSAEEIQLSALPVLSKMYEQVDETPEISLISQAQRLNNVAHSFIEEREKAYLEDRMDEQVRRPNLGDIQAVCMLSDQARQNIKLAMEIKKEKTKAVIDLVKAMKR